MNNIMKLRQQREKIQLDYKHECERQEIEGKNFIYDNQKEAAFEAITHFTNGKKLVLIVAQPGTGKTGTFAEIAYQLATHIDDEHCVPAENIHIISGMNDTDWNKQFKKNLLPSFKENIYHRGVLMKQKDKISDIRNGLITIDECHIASGKNMTVSHLLVGTGLTDINVVSERRVRMLDISATPESVAWDITAWGEKAAIVRLLPGPSYKGFSVMLEENRIREAKTFATMDNVREWFQLFETRYQNTSKKYFPVRVSDHKSLDNIYSACVEFGWICKHHDSTTRIENIDIEMAVAPQNHTIIIIKEFWRASKRLIHKHVGGSYEQIPQKRNVTTASQSTIGRFCDNFNYEGDALDPNLRPVHFGDKESIKAYVLWFNEGCDFRKANYTSTRINSNNGDVHAKPSKSHPSIYQNLDAVEDEDEDEAKKHVPIVLPMENSEIVRIHGLRTEQKRKALSEILKQHLRENNKEVLAERIKTFAVGQISRPDTEGSRKRNIDDPVNAALNNKKYSLNVKDKEKNSWQAVFDDRGNRVIFMIYCSIA